MWGQRPRLDDDETKMALAAEEAEAEGEGESADSEHERVKSEEDGGFLVRGPGGLGGGGTTGGNGKEATCFALLSFPSRFNRLNHVVCRVRDIFRRPLSVESFVLYFCGHTYTSIFFSSFFALGCLYLVFLFVEDNLLCMSVCMYGWYLVCVCVCVCVFFFTVFLCLFVVCVRKESFLSHIFVAFKIVSNFYCFQDFLSVVDYAVHICTHTAIGKVKILFVYLPLSDTYLIYLVSLLCKYVFVARVV